MSNRCTDVSPRQMGMLLQWVNGVLYTRYTSLHHLHNGSVWCQLMNVIFPNKVLMHLIIFDGNERSICVHNLTLLKWAFEDAEIPYKLQINKLAAGSVTHILRITRLFIELFLYYGKEQMLSDTDTHLGDPLLIALLKLAHTEVKKMQRESRKDKESKVAEFFDLHVFNIKKKESNKKSKQANSHKSPTTSAISMSSSAEKLIEQNLHLFFEFVSPEERKLLIQEEQEKEMIEERQRQLEAMEKKIKEREKKDKVLMERRQRQLEAIEIRIKQRQIEDMEKMEQRQRYLDAVEQEIREHERKDEEIRQRLQTALEKDIEERERQESKEIELQDKFPATAEKTIEDKQEPNLQNINQCYQLEQAFEQKLQEWKPKEASDLVAGWPVRASLSESACWSPTKRHHYTMPIHMKRVREMCVQFKKRISGGYSARSSSKSEIGKPQGEIPKAKSETLNKIEANAKIVKHKKSHKKQHRNKNMEDDDYPDDLKTLIKIHKRMKHDQKLLEGLWERSRQRRGKDSELLTTTDSHL